MYIVQVPGFSHPNWKWRNQRRLLSHRCSPLWHSSPLRYLHIGSPHPKTSMVPFLLVSSPFSLYATYWISPAPSSGSLPSNGRAHTDTSLTYVCSLNPLSFSIPPKPSPTSLINAALYTVTNSALSCWASSAVSRYHGLMEMESRPFLARLVSSPAGLQEYLRRSVWSKHAGVLSYHVPRYTGGFTRLWLQVKFNDDPSLHLAEECLDILANHITNGGGIWPVNIFPARELPFFSIRSNSTLFPKSNTSPSGSRVLPSSGMLLFGKPRWKSSSTAHMNSSRTKSCASIRLSPLFCLLLTRSVSQNKGTARTPFVSMLLEPAKAKSHAFDLSSMPFPSDSSDASGTTVVAENSTKQEKHTIPTRVPQTSSSPTISGGPPTRCAPVGPSPLFQ